MQPDIVNTERESQLELKTKECYKPIAKLFLLEYLNLAVASNKAVFSC